MGELAISRMQNVVLRSNLISFSLKEQLRNRTEDQTRLEGQIAELNENMRRYVTEVKRIEEVLAIKEKERHEILQQYKTLSLEIETSESYGRKMAAKAESVEVQLAARTAELEASHRRLADLEKDLVEMTVSNETYRAQLAALGAKVDLAQSQLKEAKSQATWVNSDMSNIHELAVQLGSQKVISASFLILPFWEASSYNLGVI